MSATSCTCIRDATLVRLVPDPMCPAWRLHDRFPVERPAVQER